MIRTLRNAVIVVAAAALAACAQRGGAGGSAGGDDPCNPAAGALVGAAVGALIGGGDRTVKGALIGGSLGALACVAYNYNARQTKSAEQVGKEYSARNNNQLPPAPLVTAYRTESARATAKGGDEVTVTSNIEVVPGRTEPLKELREEFSIIDPSGNERSKLTKTPAPAGSTGGAYVSTLEFTFPKGVPAGQYQVASKVYVNGKPAQSSAVKIQVARAASGDTVIVDVQPAAF
jgi:hypothetical protein